jgi:hypothetical protein
MRPVLGGRRYFCQRPRLNLITEVLREAQTSVSLCQGLVPVKARHKSPLPLRAAL